MLMVVLASACLGEAAIPSAAGETAATPAPVATSAPLATPTPGATEFMAAMQRVRMNLPEPPDSATLKAYAIYDYLTAARLRRILELHTGR